MMNETGTVSNEYIKNIVTDYDALSERCDEVDLVKLNQEVRNIILCLKNTIRANPDVCALSANQIGFDKRIICVNFSGDIRTFINPIISKSSGMELSREYCHSVPNKSYIRLRNSTVEITYQTPLGKIKTVELVGLAARLMQHHIDHLDGLLVSDIGLEIDEEFDNATQEERNAVIEMYFDSLDISKKEIENDIENDPEAKQILDAGRFIESVRKGETILEPIDDEEDNSSEGDSPTCEPDTSSK